MYNTLLAILASQFLNVPYKWSGNNYDGLDCSGFVLLSLSNVGVVLPDMPSQSIYHWAINNKSFQSCEPDEPDCLLFFGHSVNYIKHVSIGLGKYPGYEDRGPFMIEAGGSGRDSLHLSKEELARRDARVRIKPVSNRSDLVASIKITY